MAMMSSEAQPVTHTSVYQDRLEMGTATLGAMTYTTVDYPGLQNLREPGMPSLPVDYINFSVPWNATGFSVAASCYGVEMLALSHPVFPCQSFEGGNATPPDNVVYSIGGTYPSQTAWVTSDGMLAGENRIVTVAVMPMSFIRGTSGDTLCVSETVDLSLSYSLSSATVVSPVVRRDTTLRNKGYGLVRGLVVNPGDVSENSYSSSLNKQGYNLPLNPLDPVGVPSTYLIVTTQELRHSMRRLAALQMQKGINVKIVTINEAISDPLACNGDYFYYYDYPDLVPVDSVLLFSDDAGKLRQYIKTQYSYHGTEYALLAGDGVPYRTWYNRQTDLYFSDMNGYWSSSTTYDLGELTVSRLLGSSPEQFDNYTDKLFRYELNPGKGDRSYLGRALNCVGFGYTSLSMPGQLQNVFDQETYLNPEIDEYELTGCDLLDTIMTNRYGFIYTFNDGFPSGIKVYGEDINEVSHYLWAIDSVKVAPDVVDNENGNGLNMLDDKYYPSVYLSSFGQTMPFSTIPGYGSNMNYGESFTMGKDYGGPAFIGLTGEVPEFKAYDFTRNLLPDIGSYNYSLADLVLMSKNNLQRINKESYKDIHNFNVLGDPALCVWTSIPLQFNDISVTRTNNSIAVSGTASGIKVSYCSNDGSVGLVTATSSGVNLVDVDPNSTIMLYRNNYIPYIAPLIIQNTDFDHSQYVIASEVTAGRSVDSGRTNGDVTIKSGVEYEIEAAGEVTLAGGFKIEKGATFSVRPSCF